MTAIVMMGLTPYAPPLPMADDLLSQDLGFATIAISPSLTAQGQVMRRHWDGRVTIDAGGRLMTGRPVGAAPAGSWWRGLTGHA